VWALDVLISQFLRAAEQSSYRRDPASGNSPASEIIIMLFIMVYF
jgi:hypothetical protein